MSAGPSAKSAKLNLAWVTIWQVSPARPSSAFANHRSRDRTVIGICFMEYFPNFTTKACCQWQEQPNPMTAQHKLRRSSPMRRGHFSPQRRLQPKMRTKPKQVQQSLPGDRPSQKTFLLYRQQQQSRDLRQHSHPRMSWLNSSLRAQISRSNSKQFLPINGQLASSGNNELEPNVTLASLQTLSNP